MRYVSQNRKSFPFFIRFGINRRWQLIIPTKYIITNGVGTGFLVMTPETSYACPCSKTNQISINCTNDLIRTT